MKGVVSKEDIQSRQKNYIDPSFSAAVIAWQKKHGRHVLPWQNTRDAYRVWLSEIMLQQTQVSAVIPYYQKFLQRFPTVYSLAEAPSEDVMAHWSGLGYYTRARNLHRCAQRVVSEYNGQFPDDPEKLADLPGIGRSTAAAIAAFSYGRRAAILDGNVKRVFARVFGINGYPGSKPIEDDLWLRAVALLPATGIEAYTQGLMDLGATLCTRSKPDCVICPLASRCVALKTQRVAELPEKKPKKAVPTQETVMLVIVQNNRVLLQQRPNTGIWGGLLSLPEMNAEEDVDILRTQMQNWIKKDQGEMTSVTRLTTFMHVFTHFKLTIHPFLLNVSGQMVLPSDYLWYDLANVTNAPLPAPVKKLLLSLSAQRDLFSA